MGNVHGGDERCWLPKPDLDVEAVFDKHLKALSRAKRADKLFLTIAAAFAEAERDRIRERIGRVKADQKARGRYLGGKVPSGSVAATMASLSTRPSKRRFAKWLRFGPRERR
jgi:hypothetical protein